MASHKYSTFIFLFSILLKDSIKRLKFVKEKVAYKFLYFHDSTQRQNDNADNTR